MFLSSIALADAETEAELKEARSDMTSNPQRAYELAVKLDQKGNCHGTGILASLYGKGEVVKKDKQKMIELHTKSANGGCALSAGLIGTFYRTGYPPILPVDLNKAAYWHGKAFEFDNSLCNNAKWAATIYDENGNQVDALNWYKKAHSQNSCKSDQDIVSRIKALEVTQQKQVEDMREDPPVAGIKLSIGGSGDSPSKPKKKPKKKN